MVILISYGSDMRPALHDFTSISKCEFAAKEIKSKVIGRTIVQAFCVEK